jgi:hypothetical protein
MITKFRFFGLQDHVDDEPAFMKAIVFHAALDIAAYERACSVAADDILRRDTFDAAAAHVLVAQFDPIALVLDMENLAAAAHHDILPPTQMVAQQFFKVWLVEPVVRPPALWPFTLRPRPVEKQFALRIDEAHARMVMGLFFHLVGDADPLEDAHHLGIEMHRTRQVIMCAFPLQNERFQPALAQKVSERCTGRPIADNGDIEMLHGYFPCFASSP